MGIFSGVRNAFAKAESAPSVFVKLAEAEVKKVEAEGRILAIDAAHKLKIEAIDFFEKEVTRVHAAADAIHSRFDDILAKL